MKFSEKGFTLKELLVSLAVVSVATAWGLPHLVEMIPNYRLTSAARSLVVQIHRAKLRAINQSTICYFDFDLDGDGNIDTSAGGNIIWAIDSDKTDGIDQLDKYLDTDDDGIISVSDNPIGEDLATPVPLDRIKAVRIWILARTGNEERGHSDTATYVVANQRVPANDGNRRQLVITTVKCRNMAL